MSTLDLETAAIALCLAFLFLLSLVEAAITQSNPLTLRMILEREEKRAEPLLTLILEDKMQVLVPLLLGTQTALITIAILTTHLSLREWGGWGVAYSFAIIFLISMFFRQLLPRLLTQNEPERKMVRLLVLVKPVLKVLRSPALPVWTVLRLHRQLHDTSKPAADPSKEETTEEEIQAYLEIGEDEGIIQKEDSELIQSVVEFGDTLVREVMTPRTKIVACSEDATIGELKDIMVNHRHSRIPIYRGDVDHIVGIAYIRQLLAQYTPESERDPIKGMVHPALFVPETKRVAALMKELQKRGDHIAIVIDEFGGVAGLVTMEDLLEEIVGEIHDEDQANVSEIVEEGPRTHVMRGGTEISRLEGLTGKKFSSHDCSTVAGLVVAYLGRVPAPGEEFDLQGLRIRVLDADRKRVHKVRVQIL